ncbi:hypothetical protein [Streptomyces caatingaensis]|uniref:Uncharacterized protein n=1 Tax=Streptomyces caatingaensis TaxID=1678637 RepID=A0A0K9XIU1_9ACTN|nr:hypothetical protein [Streptomyces caatingaensis]KNB52986.1 hypothetical protein AC230_10305 [Streptomyces caatingaensis]
MGTTWVDRGLPYWWRRLKMTLTWLFFSTVLGAMSLASGWAVAKDGPVALTVFLVVYAVLGTGVVCLVAQDIRRQDRHGVLSVPVRRRSKRFWTVVSVLAAAASVVLALLQIFEVAVAPLCLAVTLPHLVRSFGRYAVGERHEHQRAEIYRPHTPRNRNTANTRR